MAMDYFDEIYVVSLVERQDRRDIVKCKMDEQGLPFTFFDAVKDNNGILGLVKSMQGLFSLALSKNQSRILVFEDDVDFLVPNVQNFLLEVLPQLPQDYYTFHLGLNLLSQPKRISQNILQIHQSYSTHAISYQKESMELILALLQQRELQPYDIFLRDAIQIHMKSYCTMPMIATQRTNYSDIELKETDWRTLMAMTFNMHTKNLQRMANEIAYCIGTHKLNGHEITVDPTIHQMQHPELVGEVCDCKRFVYSEEMCGCTIKEWRVTWKENLNA